MKLFGNNFLDASGVTVTASSEITTLPGANVLHDHLSRVWRTGTSSATETITFDLGTAQTVTAGAAHIEDATTENQANWAANSSDSWGAPPYSGASVLYGSGPLFTYFTGSATYRYWRFSWTKPSAGVQRNFGRIYLGSHTDFGNVIDYDGVEDTHVSLGRSTRSRGGQTFSEQKPSYRRIVLSLTGISEANYQILRGYFDTLGNHTPFWLLLDKYSNNPTPGYGMVYCKFADELSRSNPAYDGSSFYWDVRLVVEEQL